MSGSEKFVRYGVRVGPYGVPMTFDTRAEAEKRRGRSSDVVRITTEPVGLRWIGSLADVMDLYDGPDRVGTVQVVSDGYMWSANDRSNGFAATLDEAKAIVEAAVKSTWGVS